TRYYSPSRGLGDVYKRQVLLSQAMLLPQLTYARVTALLIQLHHLVHALHHEIYEEASEPVSYTHLTLPTN
ncbi:hypothetical protein H8933_18685, partial [Bacillus pumilus]